jgi:two-component system response regulator HydG
MNDEERRLRAALELAGGSTPKAAVILGVSRMTVWRWVKKYGIEIERRIKPAA